MPLPPRTCFFGVPAMGSWQIRARQIAAARPQWTSRADLEPDDILGHQVFVAVKRPFRHRLRLLQRLGKVTVYDVVDCWKQPEDGLLHREPAAMRRFFAEWFRDLPVDGVVFPNRTMLEDLGDLVPNPICIYHHYWPGLEPIAIRPRAEVVGYEGAAEYLGEWREVVERACRKLGLRFVVNPKDLRSIDIGFAARGGPHGSPMAHRYKSNVKLANFVGAGMPCLVEAAECAYRETDPGEVRFFATAAELEAGLADLLPEATRRRVQQNFLAARPSFALAAIAATYERYLRGLVAARRGGAAAAAGGTAAGGTAAGGTAAGGASG